MDAFEFHLSTMIAGYNQMLASENATPEQATVYGQYINALDRYRCMRKKVVESLADKVGNEAATDIVELVDAVGEMLGARMAIENVSPRSVRNQ